MIIDYWAEKTDNQIVLNYNSESKIGNLGKDESAQENVDEFKWSDIA